MTKMRPETALYADLDSTATESDIQATLAKLRWIERENETELEEAEVMDNIENSDKDKFDKVELESRCVWNESDNSIDMGRARATDLRGNKRINLPQPLDPKKEGLLQARSVLWKETIESYKREFCGQKGQQRQTLDPDLLSGIQKLKKRGALQLLVVLIAQQQRRLSGLIRTK